MSEYKRLTGQKWTDDIDLTKEYGYSYIYKRLYELEDKIMDGTLVELPYKLGTKLYFLVLHMFDGYFEIFETDLWVYVSRYKDEFGGVDFYIEINDVDFDCETWVIVHYYSSKAEAEARLKELQEEQK